MTYSIIFTNNDSLEEFWADFASGKGLIEMVYESSKMGLTEISALLESGWSEDLSALAGDLAKLTKSDNQNVAKSAAIVLETLQESELTEGVASLTNGIASDDSDPGGEPGTGSRRAQETTGEAQGGDPEETPEQMLAKALAPVGDGLIDAAYLASSPETGRPLLIGNFGDWAEGDSIDKFKEIASGLGIDVAQENEAGDLTEIYPGAVMIEIPKELTRTQESMLRNWENYP